MDFNDVLKTYDIEASRVRMVRHGYKELDTLDAFRNNRPLLEAYQSFQIGDKYGDANYIAVFSPHHGTHALFLGFWRIDGQTHALNAPGDKLALVKRFDWPLHNPNWSYYTLTPVDIAKDLSERLVIDWGGSTVSWVHRRTDKPAIM